MKATELLCLGCNKRLVPPDDLSDECDYFCEECFYSEEIANEMRSFHERLISGEFNEKAREIAERTKGEPSIFNKTGDKFSLSIYGRIEKEDV